MDTARNQTRQARQQRAQLAGARANSTSAEQATCQSFERRPEAMGLCRVSGILVPIKAFGSDAGVGVIAERGRRKRFRKMKPAKSL